VNRRLTLSQTSISYSRTFNITELNPSSRALAANPKNAIWVRLLRPGDSVPRHFTMPIVDQLEGHRRLTSPL